MCMVDHRGRIALDSVYHCSDDGSFCVNFMVMVNYMMLREESRLLLSRVQ